MRQDVSAGPAPDSQLPDISLRGAWGSIGYFHKYSRTTSLVRGTITRAALWIRSWEHFSSCAARCLTYLTASTNASLFITRIWTSLFARGGVAGAPISYQRPSRCTAEAGAASTSRLHGCSILCAA